MNNPPSSSIQVPGNWAKRNQGAPKLLVVAVAAVVGLYAVYFLFQEIYPGFRRLDVFVWLMLPDMLLGATTDAGDTGSSFTVFDRLLPLGLAAAWLGVASWIGRPLLGKLSKHIGTAESLALSCLAGLSLLSTATLLIGLFGALSRVTLLVVVGVFALFSVWLRTRLSRSVTDSDELPKESVADFQNGQVANWLWRLVPVCAVALAVAYVLSSLMPAFEFDVVEYHLQGPKEFYQAGRIAFTPHNVYLNMPLGAEMHSLAMMVLVGGDDGWWLGGIAGKTITGSYSLLAALLVGGFVARHFGTTAGWAAAALLLSAPGNLHVAGCGLIDLALGAYLMASVICLTELAKRRAQADLVAWLYQLSPLALFFAGSAAACKYPGLIFAVLPCLLIVIVIGKKLWLNRPAIQPLALSIAALLITVFPWYLKNLVATGNPVYPLASQAMGSGNLTAEQVQRWNKAHQVPVTNNGSKYGWSALSNSISQIVVRNDFLPVTLMPLVLAGFVSIPIALRRSRNGTRNTLNQQLRDWTFHPSFLSMLVGAWIFLVWFFLTHRIDRFWLPALPLMAVIAGVMVHWLQVNRLQSFAALCVLISTIYGGLISLSNLQCDSRWFVAYSALRNDIGTKELPGRMPLTIGWINSNLPPEARLLLLGQAQAYRFERALQYATCFNTPIGEEELRNRSVDEQRRWLKAAGFTHILVQWSEIDRYRSPGNYGFSTWPTREDVEALVQSGVVRRLTEDWPVDISSAALLEVK